MSGAIRQQVVSAAQRWNLPIAIAIGLVLGPPVLSAEGQTRTPTGAASVVSVAVGSATGKPGEQVTIEVTLHTAGFAVVGVQNDITFFPAQTALVDCVVNPDLGKDLTQFSRGYSGLRAIVFGANVDPIPDGSVLYTCTFAVTADAAPRDWPLSVAHVIVSSPSGEQLPVVGSSGVISVPGTRPTRSPTPSPTSVVPAIIVDSVGGVPGQQIPVSVRLQAGSARIAGTENAIEFDGVDVRVVATADGRPDCHANPEIDKGATRFAFQPPGCTGSECTRVRALVLSFVNVDPIPDGVILYTCIVGIAADARQQVEHPLDISQVGMSDPDGQPIRDAIGIKGSVYVVPPVATPTPAGPSIIVDPVRGQPGDDVVITARLASAGASVAGTQNDIVFDSLNTPLAALANGKPECVVNPDIDKGATSFAFLPSGCSGNACTAIRALVLATDNSAPIADGAVLYTCTVSVAPAALTGVYPLSIDGVVLSTPDGVRVAEAVDSSSAVLVGIGHDPHTPGDPGRPPESAATRTAVPTRAATASPTASLQPAATASPRAATASDGGTTAGFADGGGCSISESSEQRGWLLLLPLVALLARAKLRLLRRCPEQTLRR